MRFTNIEYIKHVTCPILFIHGQQDTLIPIEHTIKLKENCRCPYEVIFPDEMNHNQFDYDNDLIIPLKDFLKRNTGFKSGECTKFSIPDSIFEIPPFIRENILNVKYKNKSTFSCFGPCNGDLENDKIK